MKTETIDKLCCSFDKSDLELTTITADVEGNILEGFLNCTECNRIYPIVKGIPIMSPNEYREFKLEQPLYEQWSKYLEGKKVENFTLVKEEVAAIDKA
ncbi:MAG: hypothetical protein GYB39_03210 [Algicola sp.]|nr:hypothetical protein [Algicola sp.]